MGFTESLRTELLHDGSRIHVARVEMPALNTPMFDWSRSRLPRDPKPIPPIFQPEVGARAVVWAAHHRRRELYVGWPTVEAIVLGEKLAPGIGDRYLAKRGYELQQTDVPTPPDRPDNLLAPVPGDRGAHGRFDNRARRSSLELWAATHRSELALATFGVAAALLVMLARPRRTLFT